MVEKDASRLLILWTSGEKETALHMVGMYAVNARSHAWWNEVTVLIWGAAARLAAQDEDVQAKIADLRAAGVRVTACRSCAEKLGVVEKLEEMQIEVFYAGGFLTNWIKSGDQLLSV